MRIFLFLALSTALSLNGCAAVDIKPISKDDANKAHSSGSSVNGYIVYEPVVVVEISQKEVCTEKDKKGNCKDTQTQCVAGTPFVLPDYSKPYLVNIRTGFGKSGAEITINEGWRLGNVKDNADNTAVLGTIEKLIGFRSAIIPFGVREKSICKAPGLYKVDIEEDRMVLKPLFEY